METSIHPTKFNKAITLLFIISLFVVVGISFYTYYLKRDYRFIVEASCDTQSEVCYIRDCSEEGVCPPNNLEEFKMFYVRGSDFDTCADDSCQAECTTGKIYCEEIPCGGSPTDECSLK